MTDTATPTPKIAPAPATFARLVGAMARRDTLVQLVEECTEPLQDLAPALRASRRIFDGAWVVGLTSGGASDPARLYSRVDFELRLGDELTIRCRTTIRQRDLETLSLDTATDDAGLQRVREFVEGGLCRFADGYFARE